jgi:hypothetical protein
MKKIFASLLILYHALLQAKVEEIKQLPIGNYALPTSQQPGPLFGFGQTIVDKGDVQVYLFIDYFKGKLITIESYEPSILCGISDSLALLIGVPEFAKVKNGANQSAGAGDFFAQFEYAFYKRDTLYDGTQTTIVGNMTFPSGSVTKNPPTGFGSVSFFLGGTAEYMDFNWYYFGALGATITTPAHHEIQFANIYFYQLGISRNISYGSNKWIFNVMLEIDGIYTDHMIGANGVTTANSGGHTLYIGPSLWWSTQQLLIQGGVAYPVVQHLFGRQNKIDFQFSLNMAWKFNGPSNDSEESED